MCVCGGGGGSGPCVPSPGCAHVYLPENIIMCIILAFILFLLPKFNRNDNGYMWVRGGLDPVSLPLDVPTFTYQRTSSCASYWLLFHFFSPSSTGMIMDTCGGGGGGSRPCVPSPGCAMFTYQRTSSCASYWLLFYFSSPSSTGMIMDTWFGRGGGRSRPCIPSPGCAMFTYQRTSSCASYWLLFYFSSPNSTGMIMDTH